MAIHIATLKGGIYLATFMYKIVNTMKRYLPYLEDGENPIGSLKNIEIAGEIKLE